MAATTQAVHKPRFYAGFYLRTRRQVRFWGWGNRIEDTREDTRKRERASAAGLAQSRSALADWLRMAHAVLDNQSSESPAPPKVPDASAKGD